MSPRRASLLFCYIRTGEPHHSAAAEVVAGPYAGLGLLQPFSATLKHLHPHDSMSSLLLAVKAVIQHL
ncbi:hypothetical protein [Paenibacillus sp. NPDC057934]|uniref:hypothetical protein n=1 Tax=Paenibacillus sp. NPDC057934 TaxID=3346282 RepID=UPI0036D9EC94